MTAGVGLFATMSGVIASSLADSGDSTTQEELKRLTAAVGELTRQMEALGRKAP